MISFERGGTRFHYRAAAVCYHSGHVLLHRFILDDFWALPGGRVEMGEESAQTVLRELDEELGAPARGARIERLLWVVENFFTYNGQRQHELGLYYLVTLPSDSPLLDTTRDYTGIETQAFGADDTTETFKLIFRWFPLATLANEPIYPALLRARLAAPLPAHPEHLIQRDRDKEL